MTTSDPTTYQIEGTYTGVDDLSDVLAQVGLRLVPDGRLQVIADTERTRWCDEHDLPYSTIRTGDDRMVCWYIWWSEAMERANRLHPKPLTYSEPKPCRSSKRIVIRPNTLTQEDNKCPD